MCLSSEENGGRDVTGDNGAFVHLIAVNATDVASMAASETSVIWSPRSNISLYGNDFHLETELCYFTYLFTNSTVADDGHLLTS